MEEKMNGLAMILKRYTPVLRVQKYKSDINRGHL